MFFTKQKAGGASLACTQHAKRSLENNTHVLALTTPPPEAYHSTVSIETKPPSLTRSYVMSKPSLKVFISAQFPLTH